MNEKPAAPETTDYLPLLEAQSKLIEEMRKALVEIQELSADTPTEEDAIGSLDAIYSICEKVLL